MADVLIVEDDAPIRRMLQRTLEAEGHRARTATSGGDALSEVERQTPDLVVLDVVIPGPDGLSVSRRLRSKGMAMPILFLTARDAVADRVAGLDAGGDDYLVKPFAAEELLARVRALLRRGQEPAAVLAAGGIQLDLSTRVVTVSGRPIELTDRETELLAALMRHPGRVVGRAALLESIWEGATAADGNVLDRYVSYLRRKLGDPAVIRTVRGVGFSLRA
jgi:two-component system, OmpR family, response regulator MprA